MCRRRIIRSRLDRDCLTPSLRLASEARLQHIYSSSSTGSGSLTASDGVMFINHHVRRWPNFIIKRGCQASGVPRNKLRVISGQAPSARATGRYMNPASKRLYSGSPAGHSAGQSRDFWSMAAVGTLLAAARARLAVGEKPVNKRLLGPSAGRIASCSTCSSQP